jgi:GNAT superfamily N-acetyltransferase
VNEGRGGYVISTEKSRLDVARIHAWLDASYWAKGRTVETIVRSIEGSYCFGVYAPDGTQAGFARVVTDFATFAWICDVIVDEAHRGRSIGKLLVREIVADPRLQGLRRLLLATADAHELYRRYGGFIPIAAPDRWMERFRPSPAEAAGFNVLGFDGAESQQ